MAGVAIALENELQNAARIAELERQLHTERRQAAEREAAYRENVIVLLTHIEDTVDDHNWGKLSTPLWNAVTAPQPSPEHSAAAPAAQGAPAGAVDAGSLTEAVERIRTYLQAHKLFDKSDILRLKADSILKVSDIELALAALAATPKVSAGLPRAAGQSDWVDCPICREPDMNKITDEDGNALIYCVNHCCPSNGGPAQD